MHEKRNIFVSGSTRGLGLAFTKRLAARGHNSFMTDILRKLQPSTEKQTTRMKLSKGYLNGGEYHFSACNLLNDHDAKNSAFGTNIWIHRRSNR